jgi:UDP-glucose 4-epimerase
VNRKCICDGERWGNTSFDPLYPLSEAGKGLGGDMRVAITGVSGYLGTLLLSRLEQVPEIESIVGINRKPPRAESPKLSFHSLDINGPITKVLADERVHALLHLAWVFDPIHDEKATRRVNIDGTRNC